MDRTRIPGGFLKAIFCCFSTPLLSPRELSRNFTVLPLEILFLLLFKYEASDVFAVFTRNASKKSTWLMMMVTKEVIYRRPTPFTLIVPDESFGVLWYLHNIHKHRSLETILDKLFSGHLNPFSTPPPPPTIQWKRGRRL